MILYADNNNNNKKKKKKKKNQSDHMGAWADLGLRCPHIL